MNAGFVEKKNDFKRNKMITLHIFANSFWNTGQGMTGGDKRILELLKRWDMDSSLPFTCIIYAPQKFIDMTLCEGICNMSFCATSTVSSENKGIITSYLIHTAKALTLIPYFKRDCLFYSTSDFFTDTIPCMLGKFFNKKAKWISLIHHIIESYKTRPGKKITNLISYCAQRISLFMIRMFSDKILVVSPLVRDFFYRKGITPDRITLVNNGVDVNFIDELQPYKVPSKKYDVIMLARLAPSKGIYDLPEIWKAICLDNPQAKLGLIGGGSDEIISELKQLFLDKGLSQNVDILGYLDNTAAYRYLKSSKVFLFTSREEGWGISIAEAMTCGLPVVAFELPVYKYIFPKGIILIKNRNIVEIAKEVSRLLQDPKLRETLGAEGKQLIMSNYTWDIIAQEEKNIIVDIKS